MKLTFLIFITVLFQLVFSWGPLTHQTFGCFLKGLKLNATCFPSDGPIYSFNLGGGAPDSVKYLEPKLHTFEFAKWQYLFALKNQKEFSVDNFNPIEFSLGFASHLSQDLIGHYKKSYLSKNNRLIQFAVDSRMVHRTEPSMKIFRAQKYTLTGKRFIHKANEFYELKKPSYKSHNFTAISDTIASFERLISTELPLAKLNFLYFSQQKFLDHCEPKTKELAEKNFQTAHGWSQDASRLVQSLLKDNKIQPSDVDAIMKKYAADLFQKYGSNCNEK
eukprot:gene9933-2254_t